MLKCPNCNAEINFDPFNQDVKCYYCGSTFNIVDLENPELKKLEGAEKEKDTYTGEVYKCNQCGASLMTFDDTAITFCSYCGSQAIIKDKLVEYNNPDFVIPFMKTKRECIEAYKKKVNDFILAPNYLKEDFQVENFRGIYMPYGVYNLQKKGTIENKCEKRSGRVGNYIYYDQFKISTKVDVSYDGLSFDLISKFYDIFSTSIPFNYNEAVPFNIHYLHGYYADSLDVNKTEYNKVAQNIVMPDVVRKLKKDRVLIRYDITSPEIDFDCDSRIGMFPIYFLATRDKKGENVHYAAVNGQTGKVACDLPIDFGKYLIVSAMVAIIIFLIINLFLVLTPTKLAIFAIAMAIINIFMSINQAKKINERMNHSADIGLSKVNGRNIDKLDLGLYGVKEKQKNKRKTKIIVVVSLLVLLILFAWIKLGYYLLGVLLGVVIFFVLAFSPIIIFWILSLFSSKKIQNCFKWIVSLFTSKGSQKQKSNKPKTLRYIYKEIIGIIIALIVIFSKLPEDMYYYGATFISLSLVVWSFRDLVKEHNLLSASKLPQLNERGGNK